VRADDPGQVDGNVAFAHLRAFDPDTAGVAALEDKYRHGGLGDVAVKRRLEELLEAVIGPIREAPRRYWPMYVLYSRSIRCEALTISRSSAIMSPVQHRISGAALSFSLEDEMRLLREELTKAPARIGRTLVKDGPLRVTLVGVRADRGMHEHRAAGPVTIHVLEGAIEVSADGRDWPLRAGELLALDGGIAHAVMSATGGIFLLTVMHGDVEAQRTE
jgi:quercetin dioxygenase-like cupin family protein